MEKTIDDYVKALPEIYQRIWKHPEYDKSSRVCEDRTVYIVKAVKSLQEKLGKKNIRVLDLGCAQGYFCFTLKEIGCEVAGIDFCAQNIDLCKALSEENGLVCSFALEKLSKEFVENITAGEYDVVLCLSVIHHVANENGFDYARCIFEELSRKVGIVISELAVKSEPLYWNKNLPNRYEDWFTNIAFFDELSFFPTHLSNVFRPLVVFSGKYFYCEGKFFEFSEWKKKSYELKEEDDGRRYYQNDNQLMKLCKSSEYFVNEVINEVNFCKENQQINFLPKVLAFEKKSTGVLAVYEINKGKLLIEQNVSELKISNDKIISDILNNLVVLEKIGFYHGDIRLWNVCVKDDEAFLIDFGNIQRDIVDSVASQFAPAMRYTVYDAFLALVYDILTQKSYGSIRGYGYYLLSVSYDFSKIEKKYEIFFKSCLLLKDEDNSFERLKKLFDECVVQEKFVSFSDSDEIKILEKLVKRSACEKTDFTEFVKLRADFSKRLTDQQNAFIQKTSEFEQELSQQKGLIDALRNENAELNSNISALQQALVESQNELRTQREKLAELHGLILNTRHRTLYGACAWLWHKVFK